MEQVNPNQNQLNINPVKNMEEEKMKGGYFYYYLLVLVIIAFGVWLFWKGGETESPPKEVGKEAAQTMPNEKTGIREGVLKASDSPVRGNLMLVSEGKDNLYISTVRDFNSLLNKEVEVRTEPMEKGFKLLDIVGK